MAKGLRGGFGGGGHKSGGTNNMQKMLQQAQRMQAEMERDQALLADEVVEATAGGGAVKVVMKGDKTLQSLEIQQDVVDPDDVEMLQDLVMAAVNEGLAAVDRLTEERMGKYSAAMQGML